MCCLDPHVWSMPCTGYKLRYLSCHDDFVSSPPPLGRKISFFLKCLSPLHPPLPHLFNKNKAIFYSNPERLGIPERQVLKTFCQESMFFKTLNPTFLDSCSLWKKKTHFFFCFLGKKANLFSTLLGVDIEFWSATFLRTPPQSPETCHDGNHPTGCCSETTQSTCTVWILCVVKTDTVKKKKKKRISSASNRTAVLFLCFNTQLKIFWFLISSWWLVVIVDLRICCWAADPELEGRRHVQASSACSKPTVQKVCSFYWPAPEDRCLFS